MRTGSGPSVPGSRVLVTIGTPCTLSAVGTSETYRALVGGHRNAIGFAALDAGLVAVDPASGPSEPVFMHVSGEHAGQPISLDEIRAAWGPALTANMGIRRLSRDQMAAHVLTDIAAPLPHDLETGGLRRLCGLTAADVRGSSRTDMLALFDDDARLGPSLQSQLFLYGGLGALAALPTPLAELVSEPHRFLIAAGCAFGGHDGLAHLSVGMQPHSERAGDKTSDRLAYRLAASLATHGPALIQALLAPALSLTQARRRPELLQQLVMAGSPMRRVPRAAVVTGAACASALFALATTAPQLVLAYPGHVCPDIVVWTAADAALAPDARILEGFGIGAMMSVEKLEQINAGRADHERRSVAECLAPFDVDAQGTVVGHAGSGVVVTTLDFALRHFLDITSIIVGWGQSGETGGKGHFAGVGFGGENASIVALDMAARAHGCSVAEFGYYVAHATGTRTNSRSDLTVAHAARQAAAAMQGYRERLPVMRVGAPKAIGDGHSMGETGLKAVSEAIHYLLGEPAVGIPTLRRIDDEMGPVAEHFHLSPEPIRGSRESAALVSTQGFGGFNAAVALRGAHPTLLRRYDTDARQLEAYLERWADVRRERTEREARYRRTRGFVLRLVEEHGWPGVTTS